MARLLLLFALFASVGCATKPPKNPNNVCDIFFEKKTWYQDAKKSQQNWGSDIPGMMSIMFQESQFVHDAKPARRRILWLIPGPRKSNAYGYPQAKNETWNEYQKASGKYFAKRSNFSDAIDFIGWYNRQSLKRSGIALTNTKAQYLAYHEGHGGYNRGTYRNKKWLLNTAAAVDNRAYKYRSQLASCEKKLQKKKGWFW